VWALAASRKFATIDFPCPHRARTSFSTSAAKPSRPKAACRSEGSEAREPGRRVGNSGGGKVANRATKADEIEVVSAEESSELVCLKVQQIQTLGQDRKQRLRRGAQPPPW
jgi:hypothetical protein